MVDHCGQGLFHHIAWQNCPIQIITVGVPGYLGIWEYLLDIPGTPSPGQQFSRTTILAYGPRVLKDIVQRERTNMTATAYIGDSLAKDVLMANRAGCFAIWAKYGSRITTPAGMRSSRSGSAGVRTTASERVGD